jgi:hypothetical protein
MLESFRRLRKLSARSKLMKPRIYSRQVVKTPSSEIFVFLPLRLCVFAGDIPIHLVAALRRWVSVVNILSRQTRKTFSKPTDWVITGPCPNSPPMF